MTKPYVRLDKNDAAVLLVDHQAGLLSLVRDIEPDKFKNNVLALGDDYGWALVGGGSPKYLWILSRTPSLPQETLERILKLASDRGYDTDRLLFVDQTR